MVSLLHCSLVLSFFIYIIIFLRPAWLARDTALASSVHSLQEMTMQMKDKRHPLVR